MTVPRNLRRFLIAGLGVAVLAAAAAGIWQLLDDEDGSPSDAVGASATLEAPSPDDDRASTIYPEEAATISAAADARSREAVEAFVESGEDPCALPFGELLASLVFP